MKRPRRTTKSRPEYKKLLTQALDRVQQDSRALPQPGGRALRPHVAGEVLRGTAGPRQGARHYNELLGHPGNAAIMQRLQDSAAVPADLPEQRAAEGLSARPSTKRTRGSARRKASSGRSSGSASATSGPAPEALGTRRDLSNAEKQRTLRRALEDANYINAQAGQYKDVTTFMIQRAECRPGQRDRRSEGLRRSARHGPDPGPAVPELEDNVVAVKRGANRRTRSTRPKGARRPSEGIGPHPEDRARSLDRRHRRPRGQRRPPAPCLRLLERGPPLRGGHPREFRRQPVSHGRSRAGADSAHVALAAWQSAFLAAPPSADREVEIAQMIRVAPAGEELARNDQATFARKMLAKSTPIRSDLRRRRPGSARFPRGRPTTPPRRFAPGRRGLGLVSGGPAAGRQAAPSGRDRPDAGRRGEAPDGRDRQAARGGRHRGDPSRRCDRRKAFARADQERQGGVQEAIKLLIASPTRSSIIQVKEGEARPPKESRAAGSTS